MENNEITMCMDVKIDKRPEITRYQQWTRFQVKIEAVKCLPCFLRITLIDVGGESDQQNFTLLINVPGVSITLCSSRTKQHSYALCWTQNRKCCYIYFALDTESSCRRHMKWVKKSIKNLELHRRLILDERRCSRGGGLATHPVFEEFKDDSLWSQRVSEIYEEILEPQNDVSPLPRDSRRVSRRSSRTSIASGIYEEMKFFNDSPNSFNAINEELPTAPVAPTPPPLPPLRKRFNTYESEEVPNSPLDDAPIVRCNTNPETDLAKKKKYRNMLDTIFHGNGLRSKRTVSTSEDSQEHLPTMTTAAKPSKTVIKPMSTKNVSPTLPKWETAPIYANDDSMAAKLKKKSKQDEPPLDAACTKRNSFSSPDLSKINFLDTFDEQRIAELLNPSFLKCDDFDLANSMSLDESVLLPAARENKTNHQLLERHNISTRLPPNFNLSACNSSSINLIASLSSQQQVQPTKNKIIHDDLTGYCVMAPIVRKMTAIDNTLLPSVVNSLGKPFEIVSSGYSSGSYSSTASSTEDQKNAAAELVQQQVDESVVYMSMQEPTVAALREVATQTLQVSNFTGNLYENLLTLKAARELEPECLPSNSALSTSTPTESPHVEESMPTISKTTPNSTNIIITSDNEAHADEESFYQTPRRSIISIDEKIPSYYPNTCEASTKSRRRSYSPAKAYNKSLGIEKTPISTAEAEQSPLQPNSASSASSGLRQLVSSRLRRERKENLYLTSPQGIIEERKALKGSSNTTAVPSSATKASKSKKAAALKISENVYAVKHRLKKSVATVDTKHLAHQKYQHHNNNYNNNNAIVNTPKITNDAVELQHFDVLEHLPILRNNDFEFEDTGSNMEKLKSPTRPLSPSTHHLQVNQSSNTCHKLKCHSVGISPCATKTAHATMTQSAIMNSNSKTAAATASPQQQSTTTSGGVKKFASLPRFKKFDLSPLRMRITNALQRNQTPDL